MPYSAPCVILDIVRTPLRNVRLEYLQVDGLIVLRYSDTFGLEFHVPRATFH